MEECDIVTPLPQRTRACCGRTVVNVPDSTQNRYFACLVTGSFHCRNTSSCHRNSRIAGTHMARRVPSVAQRNHSAIGPARSRTLPAFYKRPVHTSFCDFSDRLLLLIVFVHSLCDLTYPAEGYF